MQTPPYTSQKPDEHVDIIRGAHEPADLRHNPIKPDRRKSQPTGTIARRRPTQLVPATVYNPPEFRIHRIRRRRR
jgi:hypothetical protein